MFIGVKKFSKTFDYYINLVTDTGSGKPLVRQMYDVTAIIN